MKTLQDSREELISKLNEGTVCPCCGQYARQYKRRINSGMARSLINLYKLGQGYHHVKDFSIDGGGDFAKLKYWGLVNEKFNDDTEKRTSGMWCINAKGIAFVENRMPLEKYVLTYNGYANGFSSEEISITDALGEKFSYKELMKC